MRYAILALPLAALASAAAAEPPQRGDKADMGDIERTLRDPATAQRLQNSLQSMTDALLDLKVGSIQAAMEGRQPTAAERNLTVGDIERAKGPRAEADLRAKLREAGPAIAQSMNTLANALPAMTKAMNDIERVIDRAAANMPDPTYPKR